MQIVATKFTLVYGPLFPILQGRLQSWIVTIHEDNVPNNTVVNASKPINFGRYFEWMPKLQTLAETYQKASIKGTELELVPSAKLLCLEIDSELSFTSHVEKLCKKLSQRIGVLKKIRSCLPTKQRLLYYNTMIRSVLHYVSSIWTSCDKENLSRVFKLQKRAARVISDANNQASSVKLFNSLQWLPFYEEVKIAKCCVAHKRNKGEVPLYIEDSLRWLDWIFCGSYFPSLSINYWKIYCDDLSSLSSTTAVQKWIISYILHIITRLCFVES